MPRRPLFLPSRLRSAALWLGLAAACIGSLRAHAKDKEAAGGARVATGPWWSLQPLARPAVPTSSGERGAGDRAAEDRGAGEAPRTAIDVFIEQKLQVEGLAPRPEADRRTLVRRLTFDLHGVPPSPEEVEAFENEDSPDAYERLVDRLLASPRYGERWARHWLDVAHYGETHGYDKDKRRPNAWPYRDYVIRSLNADKPYARFIEEQIAGDVLFPDDPDGLVGTGFIVAGPWDFVGHVELREGTVDKDIARSNDRDDMVACVMSTFASVTAHCARCHDHKFDPISQEDYYSLQAVFAGIDRADRPYDPDAAAHRERRALLAERDALESKRAALERVVDAATTPEIEHLKKEAARLEDVLKGLAASPAPGTSPSNGYHSEVMPESIAVKWVEVDLGRAVDVDRVVLVPARPTDFPDTPGFGFPVRFRVEAKRDPAGAGGGSVTLTDRTAEDVPNPGDDAVVVPGGGTPARCIRVTATKLWPRTNDFVFALAEIQVFSGGMNVAQGAAVNALDSIEAGRWGKARVVDGFTSRAPILEGGAVAKSAPGEGRRETLQRELEKVRAAARRLAEEELDAETRSALGENTGGLASVAARLEALPPARWTFAACRDFQRNGSFSPAAAPRSIHVLLRGDVRQPGKEVGPGALSCVSTLPPRFATDAGAGEGARRAALAQWLAARANMLTWRSIANRVWQYHFDRGIVESPNDFGRMGSKPTHPELLDWLAAQLIDTGGSLKALHRLIVTSAAYRQSSRGDESCAQKDADNRYLWRMNRRRLEAEEVRDALLVVSGRIDWTAGGPSVDQFRFKDDHSPTYDFESFDVDLPSGLRRSIYRFVVRSVPDPLLDSLDCPDPSVLVARRTTTLTALQALALLNSPFAVRQAVHFAERLRGSSGDARTQVEQAFRLAFGRQPTRDESRLLVEHVERFGLESACRILLNSNEFLFID